VSYPRINSNKELPSADLKAGMGVSFQFHHPKDAQACYRPQSGHSSVDRHKECPSLLRHSWWGCFIICRIMVSFDGTQDREPVERPFHHLWIDGGETEKRPPYPPRVIGSAQVNGSFLWDTTLVFIQRCLFNTMKSSKPEIIRLSGDPEAQGIAWRHAISTSHK
jgi:hypothetical protein